KSYPPTPTLLWEVELFQVALHESLCGLAEHLWTTGQWEQGIEDAVLHQVLPNARLHLGLAASRTGSLDWPACAEASEAVGVLPTVGDEEPVYGGSARLALGERQEVKDPGRRYSTPGEAVTVYAGAIATPLGASISSGAFPFADGDV